MISIDVKEIKKWGFAGTLCAIGIVFVGIISVNNIIKEKQEAAIEKLLEEEAANERALLEETKRVEEARMAEEMASLAQETFEESEESEPEIQISWQSVDDNYFSDALFIGDSRTVGLAAYSELSDIAVFYCNTGLTIKKALSKPIVDGQTIEEALKSQNFEKVYINLGINEVGTGTADSFAEKYNGLIEDIKKLEPDAIIYIQSIMRVTSEKSKKQQYGITNEIIDERNAAIEKLADNETVFYLDINPALCDEEGGLNPEYTQDGVHMKANYYNLWAEYLKENAVVREIIE